MKRAFVILFAVILLASCSRVSGTYVNESGGLYDQIEFVGNSSCNITTLGMKFPATYRIDNGYVYIHTHDGAEMLFKIQDANTLVGDSIFNENTYKKVNSASRTKDPDQ